MSKKFSYAGHTFEGIRKFSGDEDFHTVTRNQYSVVDVLTWNWSKFFVAAESVCDEDFDIFLMDGKWEVLPCHNHLFIYGKKEDERYRTYMGYRDKFVEMGMTAGGLKNDLLIFITSWLQDYGMIEIPSDCYIPFVREVDGGYVTNSILQVYHPTDADFHLPGHKVHLDTLAVVTTEDKWFVSLDDMDVSTLFQIARALNP